MKRASADSAGGGPAAAAPAEATELSAVGHYLREIGDAPVLTRSQEQALARHFGASRESVRDLLAGMPGTARRLAAHFREVQRGEGSAAALFDRVPPPQRDRALRDLAAAVTRMERRLRRAAADDPARARRAAALRRDLLALPLHPTLFDRVERSLRDGRRLLARVQGSRRRRLLRELSLDTGCPGRRLRPLLDDLERRCEERDAARNALARHNLKLVVTVAKEFRNLGVPFGDLIQEANLGLLRAIELFEPERGLKFSTYAVWWIRQALVRAVQKHSRTVRLPSHVNDRLYRLNRASERLATKLGRDPEPGELGREVGLAGVQVEELRSVQQPSLSLEHGPPTPDARPLRERLPDPGAQSPAADIDRGKIDSTMRSWLSQLEGPERAVIGRRFGFSGEERATLEGLSRELGVSRERVRRIEQDALAKLRRWARTTGFDEHDPGGEP